MLKIRTWNSIVKLQQRSDLVILNIFSNWLQHSRTHVATNQTGQDYGNGWGQWAGGKSSYALKYEQFWLLVFR